MRAARNALLLAGVALAFADSSIVVLALPDLLTRFDTSIQDVSWVITSYNVAVAFAALLAQRWEPRALARAGASVFGLASLGCAVAGDLWLLVGLRAVQGVGGALLLAAALPLLGAAGSRRFGLAATLGAAVGPALGGALTQAFDWRAIFVAQSPVVLLALAVPRPAAAADAGEAEAAPGGGRARRAAANLSLALLTGALVGALFLVVVLLVDGWRLSPLTAAGVASALPVGALAARGAARSASRAPAVGALLLAAGLASLAIVPRAAVGWPVGGLLLCGLGTGLALPSLTGWALAGARSGGTSVGARHLGLVLAFVAVTPLLTSSLSAGTERAKLLGTAQVLDAPYAIRTKVPLAVDLVRAIEHVPKGKAPDFSPQFARHPGTEGLHRQLDETVRSVVTRSFRGSFLLCALLALTSLAPLPLARPRS